MTKLSETFAVQLRYAAYRGYTLDYRLIARARYYYSVDLHGAKLGRYTVKAGR